MFFLKKITLACSLLAVLGSCSIARVEVTQSGTAPAPIGKIVVHQNWEDDTPHSKKLMADVYRELRFMLWDRGIDVRSVLRHPAADAAVAQRVYDTFQPDVVLDFKCLPVTNKFRRWLYGESPMQFDLSLPQPSASVFWSGTTTGRAATWPAAYSNEYRIAAGLVQQLQSAQIIPPVPNPKPAWPIDWQKSK
jgi:hypothetical protein